MLVQNFVDRLLGLFIVGVEVKNVSYDVAKTLVRKKLQMLHDVDDFTSRIGIL